MSILLPVSGEASYCFLVFAGNKDESTTAGLSRLKGRVEALDGSLQESDHLHGEKLASFGVLEWLAANGRHLPTEHPHPYQWSLVVLRVPLHNAKSLAYIVEHDEIFQCGSVIG